MRKIGYILLLIIILLQSGGMMFFYKIQQTYVQFQIKEVLKSNKTNFEKIILTRTEYKKSRINYDEVLVNGKMYDIKSARFVNNKIELTVINDSKEENILKKIKDFSKQKKDQNNTVPNQLQKLLSQNYVLPIDFISYTPSTFDIYFPDICLNILSSLSDIPSPPPKFV